MQKTVTVSDKYQNNYTYTCVAPVGEGFDPEFHPELTPKQMLELGVFGGKYFNDKPSEFPKEWFNNAKLSHGPKDPRLNFFEVDASMPLSHWQEKGWIHPDDPRGWFQWYSRYYLGRRLPDEDRRQIKRWKAMKRHVAQIQKNCMKGDWDCHTKQRQALLHWAYDSRKM